MIDDFFKNINIDNIKEVGCLVAIIMVSAVKYIKALYLSDIELLFMEKKAEIKKDIAACFILFILFGLINSIILMDVTFIIPIFIILAAFTFVEIIKIIIICIKWIINKFNKNKVLNEKKKDNEIYQIAYLIVGVGLLLQVVSIGLAFNVIYLTIIGSSFETLCIFMLREENMSKKSKIKIYEKDNITDSLFVYKKTNDDYLVCGDTETIHEATKIIIISMKDVKENKYNLAYAKNIVDDIGGMGDGSRRFIRIT